jgi:uncharacterized membrane protein HdeD (DUF308 family)
MPRYRHLVTFAGALLLLGGIFSLAIAWKLHGATWPRIRGVIGGGIAAYLGATLIKAGNSGWLPGWLTRVFGDPGDLD